MKIKSKKKSGGVLKTRRSSKSRPGDTDLFVDFSQKVDDAVSDQHVAFLQELLADVDDAAERLAKHPAYGTLQRYKELVRRFLDEVVQKSYQVRIHHGTAREGRQKLHVVLEAIDERMSALAESIMNKQSKSLSLVEKLDEIRGLLLDLYM